MFTRMKRDGNSLSPVLRQAWDGRPLSTLTRKDDGHLVLARVGVRRNEHARKEGPLEDEQTAVEGFCRDFRPRTKPGDQATGIGLNYRSLLNGCTHAIGAPSRISGYTSDATSVSYIW